MMYQVFVAARVTVCMAFLFYASWSDYKKREVSNSVWILFAPLAFALTFSEFFLFDFEALPFYGLCFALTSIFATILFYAGGFGGADAKALMCLALALPFYPSELLKPLMGETSPIMEMFFPVTVFSNSVILAALTAVYLLFHNLLWRIKTGCPLFEGDQRKASIGKRLLVLATGYKVHIKKLKEEWHIYPLEDVENIKESEPKRRLLVLPKDEEREGIVKRLESAIEAGIIQEKVWATPGLPMLIFMTAGLILALIYGDIVWALVRFFMGR
ncbi:prepilin peptidase [Candidatus Bathyarchaeota archaeon]|nr:prepilin peptidase [Candidatus Bathyarchaeota archaeon]